MLLSKIFKKSDRVICAVWKGFNCQNRGIAPRQSLQSVAPNLFYIFVKETMPYSSEKLALLLLSQSRRNESKFACSMSNKKMIHAIQSEYTNTCADITTHHRLEPPGGLTASLQRKQEPLVTLKDLQNSLAANALKKSKVLALLSFLKCVIFCVLSSF